MPMIKNPKRAKNEKAIQQIVDVQITPTTMRYPWYPLTEAEERERQRQQDIEYERQRRIAMERYRWQWNGDINRADD